MGKIMLQRNDFNEHSFEQLIRNELIEQLADLEFSMNEDSIRDTTLVEAFKRVIAYNSVPGTYEEGKYDE
jgi:hypothetical protein